MLRRLKYVRQVVPFHCRPGSTTVDSMSNASEWFGAANNKTSRGIIHSENKKIEDLFLKKASAIAGICFLLVYLCGIIS